MATIHGCEDKGGARLRRETERRIEREGGGRIEREMDSAGVGISRRKYFSAAGRFP